MDLETVVKLYVVCRDAFKADYAHLRETRDDKLFLIDALHCEITANALSLCVELYFGFTDSPGMETGCRSILEALTLLRMVYGDELDQEQIANFKHQSSLLFYGNLFDTGENEKDRLLNAAEDELVRKKISWIIDDYERALDSYRGKYGPDMDGKACRLAVRQALFFTRKKPSKKNSFSSLFNKQMKDIDPSGKMYDRISFFTHPWYLQSLNDLGLVRNQRQKDVEFCLQWVQEMYAEEMKEIVLDKDELLSDVEAAKAHDERADIISQICSDLCEKQTKPFAPLSFSSFCFAVLRDLLIEMNLMIGLKHPEIALSKFQTVCEFWAMNALLNNSVSSKVLTGLCQAFDYSTRIQLRKLGGFENLPTKDEAVLKTAYESAFRNPELSFEDYKQRVEKHSLSFLKDKIVDENPSFLEIVRSGLKIALPDEHLTQRKAVVLTYLFSIDVHHATGFCYTEPSDCWDYLSCKGLSGIYECLWIFTSLLTIPPNEDLSVLPSLEKLRGLLHDEAEEAQAFALKYPED